MKRLMVLSLLACMSGCAVQVTKLDVPELERSESAVISDVRPAAEKEGATFSLLITSEAYAIYRIAEDAVAPTPVRVLRHRAFEKFAAGGEPLDMTVRHLVVYRNMQAELRRGVLMGSIGGIAGAVIAGSTVKNADGILSSVVERAAFDSLAKNEHQRAFYTEEENPKRGSVFVIYMETEARGKTAFTRTIAPATLKDGEKSPEGPFSRALEEAINYHLSRYAEPLASALSE